MLCVSQYRWEVMKNIRKAIDENEGGMGEFSQGMCNQNFVFEVNFYKELDMDQMLKTVISMCCLWKFARLDQFGDDQYLLLKLICVCLLEPH